MTSYYVAILFSFFNRRCVNTVQDPHEGGNGEKNLYAGTFPNPSADKSDNNDSDDNDAEDEEDGKDKEEENSLWLYILIAAAAVAVIIIIVILVTKKQPADS